LANVTGYTYQGTYVLLIIAGIVFLVYDSYETCQTAEIFQNKLPVCGKGPFLLVVGIIVLYATKTQQPDLSTKKNIPEGSVTIVTTRVGIEGQ
jgi:hypothetical protein